MTNHEPSQPSRRTVLARSMPSRWSITKLFTRVAVDQLAGRGARAHGGSPGGGVDEHQRGVHAGAVSPEVLLTRGDRHASVF